MPPQAPQAKAIVELEGRDYISFLKLGLSTDDLVEATGLDVHKFKVDIAKGQRFTIIFRSQESKDVPAIELVRHSFEKDSDMQSAIIRVSFIRMDRKLSGFLLSNEAQAEYRLNCSGCRPGGIATIVQNPFGIHNPTGRNLLVCSSDLESKRYSVDPKETLLLRVMDGKAAQGVDVDGYPRGEVVIVRD